jgi:hypothetical protein
MSSVSAARVIAVSATAGATALTVTPSGPSSRANPMVNATTLALLAP